MGMIAAVDATGRGEIKKEQVSGAGTVDGGFSSPVIDGERVYQVDNSATSALLNFKTGQPLWRLTLAPSRRLRPFSGTANSM